MLIEASTDLVISHRDIVIDGSQRVKCQWEAHYTFSRTGRKVRNLINANFDFKDNLIVSHKDNFDLWKWSRMALGLPGLLLGWTPFMRTKIQKMANTSLTKFMANHPSYQ